MNSLMWRLHRQQAIFAGGALVVSAVVLTVTGAKMLDDYNAALSACGKTHSCSDLPGALFQGDGLIIDVVRFGTLVVPLLMGLFWGAPLVAKELEDGTHVLAWTQNITRRRWMRANVSWVLAAAAVWGGALSALVSWWQGPEDALGGGRFGAAFDISGISPIAYALFAVALGIAAGTLFRRVLPALAVTLTGFVGVRVAIGLWLRPRFLPPLQHVFRLVDNSSGAPPGSWVLSRAVVSPSGGILSSIGGIPTGCHAAYFNGTVMNCLAAHGYHRLVTYQPGSRYWTFQRIEAAIFVLLAAGLAAAAFQLVLKRDA